MRVREALDLLDETRTLTDDQTRQIRTLLRQYEDDDAWAEQIGPAYTRAQVAALLGISAQAVAKRDLLELRQRNGRVVYPVVQFDGDRPVPGIEETVRILTGSVATPWTIASWLTQADEDGRRPIDALRDGHVEVVHAAARRVAGTLRR